MILHRQLADWTAFVKYVTLLNYLSANQIKILPLNLLVVLNLHQLVHEHIDIHVK